MCKIVQSLLLGEQRTDHSFRLILAPITHPLVIPFPSFSTPIWPTRFPKYIRLRPTKLESKGNRFISLSHISLQCNAACSVGVEI